MVHHQQIYVPFLREVQVGRQFLSYPEEIRTKVNCVSRGLTVKATPIIFDLLLKVFQLSLYYDHAILA